MTTNWFNMTIIFICAFIFLTGVIVIMTKSYNEIKNWTLRQLGNIKKYIHEMYRKYGAVWDIANKIHGNELSYSVDIVFGLFMHFYKINKQDLIHWEFDAENFPEGVHEISNMCRWIVHIRHSNYKTVASIFGNSETIEYQGAVYNNMKFKINKIGELCLIPVNNTKKFSYEKFMMKLQNALYKLDTEKCNWILERRKFFGF